MQASRDSVVHRNDSGGAPMPSTIGEYIRAARALTKELLAPQPQPVQTVPSSAASALERIRAWRAGRTAV
ncbi:hypothetical protein WDZ92_43605, partial [Nostoc sp. NIES-2111]